MENITCVHPYDGELPKCISFKTFKYNYLKDLINQNDSGLKDNMIAHSIQCIEFKNNHIKINNDNCISCMFCVFGCPDNRIEIHNDTKLIAKCSSFNLDYYNSLKDDYKELFKGDLINMPKLKTTQFSVVFKDFNDFTSKNETTNISVWGANTLKYLASNSDNRISLEVGMIINTRDRGGRLDICLYDNNNLYVAEAKVSFKKMITEGRYLSQMIAYEEELEKTIAETTKINEYYKFLLIGGNEKDLLPFNHPKCSSKAGNLSFDFYNSCIEHNIKFISANALLALGKLKLHGFNINISMIINDLYNKEYVGLLSCGFIDKNLNIITIDF